MSALVVSICIFLASLLFIIFVVVTGAILIDILWNLLRFIDKRLERRYLKQRAK